MHPWLPWVSVLHEAVVAADYPITGTDTESLREATGQGGENSGWTKETYVT